MIDPRFRIIKDGVSYDTLFTDVSIPCKTCGESVSKVIYTERTGEGTWICSNMHLSKDVIGV